MSCLIAEIQCALEHVIGEKGPIILDSSSAFSSCEVDPTKRSQRRWDEMVWYGHETTDDASGEYRHIYLTPTRGTKKGTSCGVA